MMPPPPCSAVSSRWGGLRSRFADDVECFFEVAVEIEAGVDVGGGDGFSVVVSVVVVVAAGASWGEDDVCAAAVGMDVMLFEHTSKAGGICLRESRKQIQVGKKRGKGKEEKEEEEKEEQEKEEEEGGEGKEGSTREKKGGSTHATVFKKDNQRNAKANRVLGRERGGGKKNDSEICLGRRSQDRKGSKG